MRWAAKNAGSIATSGSRKIGVYLPDETLDLLRELAHGSSTKRLSFFIAAIVDEWLLERGHKLPPKTKKEVYAERQAAGFCGYCGKNIPDEGKKTCEKCLRTMRSYDYFQSNEKQQVPELEEE
jgi:hypothetical protein